MKLTDQSILEIRNAYADGATQLELAILYGCRQTNISKVVSGLTHRGVGGPILAIGRASGDRHGLVKISDAKVKEMRDARDTFGYTYKDLADIFHISPTQARLICIGKARVSNNG